MNATPLELPDDTEAAVEALADASRKTPVVVFKKSPICPVSHAAEREYRAEQMQVDAGDESSPGAVSRCDRPARDALAHRAPIR